ncbi:hypothetical protein COB87_000705 [Candidatus Wolfebacteria bacterium]|nr:hypothetical protein [Candidatus Wolfebacteria bacterium]
MKKGQQPTLAQVGHIRDLAIELGVTRDIFQTLRDDGTFTKILKDRRDQIIADRDNCRTFELKATVRQDRPYIEALEAGGPNTSIGFNSRKVGDLYLPVANEEEEVKFVLRNFPKGNGGWDKALAWAKPRGYKKTNPREAFAVAEQHDLQKLLDKNYLCLVATTKCFFKDGYKTICVEVNGQSRCAALGYPEIFDGNNYWFLFRK